MMNNLEKNLKSNKKLTDAQYKEHISKRKHIKQRSQSNKRNWIEE